MKTSFPLHSKQTPRTGRRLMLAAAGVVMLVSIAYVVGGPIASYVSQPFMVAAVFMRHENPIAVFFYTRTSLQDRIRSLEAFIDTHAYDTERLALLEERYGALFESVREDDLIPAYVVASPNQTPYDTLVLNKGASDGVREGALVYAQDSVIGRVAHAYTHSAFVILYSTPDVTVPGYIYGPDIFVKGIGMGNGVIRFGVPQGLNVAVGDPVVVPIGDASLYGTVNFIDTDASNPEQHAFVAQKQALASLRVVWVAPEALSQPSREEMLHIVEAYRSGTTTEELFLPLLPLLSSTTPRMEPTP